MVAVTGVLVAEVQVVVVFTAKAKYVVLLEMEGVVYDVELVNNAVGVELSAYQFTVSPAPIVAEMVTVPAPQLAPFTAVGAAGNALMVRV